jgi:hypothetical protein
MKRLQVLLNNKWEYVFCRNVLYYDPIITRNRAKALSASALPYFQARYASHSFRATLR